jgi:hypothetical protein
MMCTCKLGHCKLGTTNCGFCIWFGNRLFMKGLFASDSKLRHSWQYMLNRTPWSLEAWAGELSTSSTISTIPIDQYPSTWSKPQETDQFPSWGYKRNQEGYNVAYMQINWEVPFQTWTCISRDFKYSTASSSVDPLSVWTIIRINTTVTIGSNWTEA